MRIASVSKAFSGAAALALVARGRLSLGDTIGRRLTGFPRAWGRVTLREALQHTSGLPDYTKAPSFGAALQKAPHSQPSMRRLVSFVRHKPLVFSPGTRYAYSNTDNLIVAFMVQAATHRSYSQALAAQVFGSRWGCIRRRCLRGSLCVPRSSTATTTPPRRART